MNNISNKISYTIRCQQSSVSSVLNSSLYIEELSTNSVTASLKSFSLKHQIVKECKNKFYLNEDVKLSILVDNETSKNRL